ncbi:hypothetical protein JG688_00014152 [Phytophthora aleatoria]|uniref:Uncharacterized protein n=1 Tax=Phytophthora aleatoria TaxID=2496075 RepID=A0A8J5M0M8_9STRA|nr:hypothetical protein JG688_00014152 [Phytophthora aleatoria]
MTKSRYLTLSGGFPPSLFPIDAKGDAGSVIEKFLTSSSLSVLSDFRFDIIFAELFRFQGGTWLNDGAIQPSLCISSHVRE